MVGKRVLVVACDGADWSELHPALDAGALPTLQRLVETGCSGTLAAPAPAVPALVGASLATGRYPETHGVAAAFELRPDRGGVQPIGRRSWRAPSFWETLAAAGIATAVVNWWATMPADAWPGIVVDEEFAAAQAKDFASWPLPPHCVSPPSLRPVMRDLRVHPIEIGAAELSAVMPRAFAKDGRRDPRIARLRLSLARAATVHAASTYIAESESWAMLAVRYPLLADLRRDVAPRRGAADAEFRVAAIDGGYRILDLMLGRLAALAGSGSTVLIVAPGAIAATVAPALGDEAAPRRRGVLIAAGPHLARDAVIHGATAVDLYPTILACFGLSAPSDGRLLDGLFAPPLPRLDPAPAAAAVLAPERADPAAHLVALGYADRLTAAQARAMAETEIAAQRSLSDSLLARGAWRNAAVVLEALLQRVPGDYLATVNLGRCRLMLGEIETARPLAAAAIAAKPELAWGDFLMGSVKLLAGDAGAEPHFMRAQAVAAKDGDATLRLGSFALLLQRWGDAEQAFRAVIATDETIAEAHAGLGMSLHGQDRAAEAEAALRRSIGLAFHNPLAYFHLGQVLAARGDGLGAAEALRIASHQRPELIAAKTLLAGIESALVSQIVARALAGADAALASRSETD